jgi:hypothetical protein
MQNDPTNPGPNVRHDIGGWISGPMLDAEPVAAEDLQTGEVIVLDDGTCAEVTDIQHGDFWLNTGRHGQGVAIGWRSGSSSGMMFRPGSDTLLRRQS